MTIVKNKVKTQVRKSLSFLMGLVLAGCAQSRPLLRRDEIKQPNAGIQVLLMEPDVAVREITAAGLAELKADWTLAARGHVTSALRGELRKRNADLVLYKPPSGDPGKLQIHTQTIKLLEAVGTAILVHKLMSGRELPTKKGKFDWSLGSIVQVLREDHHADYALSLWIRDSHASLGRVAMMAATVNLIGVIMPGGNQVAIATLVDLRSGDIVWFNLYTNPGGDLRNGQAASKAVHDLLKDFPL